MANAITVLHYFSCWNISTVPLQYTQVWNKAIFKVLRNFIRFKLEMKLE